MSKAIRLIEYLLRIASLRNKQIRDFSEYEDILWLSDIPIQKGCFSQARGKDEEYDSDIWIEVISRPEPPLPELPLKCEAWVDRSSLRNKSDLPELLPEITKELKNPIGQRDGDEPELLYETHYLRDYPEIQQTWEKYLEDKWLPWVDEHNQWEDIKRVYTKLFSIYQNQLRLGEEYELVIGLGLLTWQTPTGQHIRRHLLVANATIEFEARLAKFTVRPHPDGAKLRAEFDMLDIEEQPLNLEENAKSLLEDSEDDPWDKNKVEGVLNALVHSIDPLGEYDNTLEKHNIHPSKKPIVEYAPALILRKRSVKGLTESLKRIKERIEKGDDIPTGFADIAEIGLENGRELNDNLDDQNRVFDGEIFFPKPSNEEQRRIVEKLRVASGVLVQGPPGTGKSHTIANLICHLLATGQRTLITAKTPRALQVLERLIPEQLRPLCINILGSGHKERKSLETSVSGILRKNDEWNEDLARQELAKLEEHLLTLRKEQAKVNRRLRDIRESETHTQVIANGRYKGTAARIAQAVNREKPKYNWFTDHVSHAAQYPFKQNELIKLLQALRFFTKEKREELNLHLPESLPSQDEFAKLIQEELETVDQEKSLISESNEQITRVLTNSNPDVVKAVQDVLYAFLKARSRLESSPYPWMAEVLRDVLSKNSALWKELARVTKDSITSVETLVEIADNNNIKIPDTIDIKMLYKDAQRLKEHLENGGKLGMGPFRPKIVRERLYIIKTIYLNGHICSTVEDLSILCDVLKVRIAFEKVWEFWVGRADKVQGPYSLQTITLKSMCDALEDALALEDFIDRYNEITKDIADIRVINWNSQSQIEELINSCRLAQIRLNKQLISEKIQKIESRILSIASQSNSHPITNELLQAIRHRDIDKFANTVTKIEELVEQRTYLQNTNESLRKLRTFLPSIARNLNKTCNEPYWDERLKNMEDAWYWAQARYWVEEYINKDDLVAVLERSKQIEDEIRKTIEKLASLRAWSFCFSRLEEEHRRHMEAWQQAMRRLGKGTGKHAPRHRREAQHHLNKCRDAVPAWVMPLHRIWDTIDPTPGAFDVIIVDEASQCGLEAIPLFYLAKKILIVGDDKQISPESGFVDRNAVFKLMNQFLYDFEHKDSFHIDASLFDHGKLRYGTQKITLREHFRCMPEIIRFSNELCYNDTPLIPLRQYGSSRLDPLQRVFIEDGYREGSHSRVINRPEAEAIVEKIVELCSDDRYYKKEMGVIVLQGDAQARLIEEMLLSRLGAEEMERRRLICGNPYSFQGDERDIIFLSMVAARDERRIGPLTKAADERRFNVAVSRAKDQVWLFHSVQLEDLSDKDLRKRLLEFFLYQGQQRVAGIDKDELERRAKYDNRSVVRPPTPFESWFEVDVALELLRKRFVVIPQYEVAGKRIDLVVEKGNSRLAIECDGDYWHGADSYEKDMQRQRQLERCGWEFFRVRESVFYLDKDKALKQLWSMLEERGFSPNVYVSNVNNDEVHKSKKLDKPNGNETLDRNDLYPSSIHEKLDSRQPSPRVIDITLKEIRKAIISAISKCPNKSCTVHSLTSRVLKELGVLTRGKPRQVFDRRVMWALNELEKKGIIQKYKAKNNRVRLIS